MPPDEVGAYYLIASIVAVGILFAQFGTQQAIVRMLGAEDADSATGGRRKAIRLGFLLVCLGIIAVGLLYTTVIGNWLGNTVFNAVPVANMAILTAGWIALRALQNFTSQVFRGLHRIGHASFFEGATTGIFLAIALAIFWVTRGSLDLDRVLMVTLGALALTLAIGFFRLSRLYSVMAPSGGPETRAILDIAFPLFVASISLQGASEMHVWILGVAVYGAAFRLARFVVIPLLIINSVIPPMVAQLFAQNEMQSVERVLRLTTTVASIPSIVIVTLLGIWAAPVLSALFGEFYAGGATALLILLFAQLINSLSGSPGVLLSMSGHQSIVMRLALLSGLLGVGTSALLVPTFGGMGAASGVAVGMVLHNMSMWLYCRKRLGVRTHMIIRGLIPALRGAYNALRMR